MPLTISLNIIMYSKWKDDGRRKKSKMFEKKGVFQSTNYCWRFNQLINNIRWMSLLFYTLLKAVKLVWFQMNQQQFSLDFEISINNNFFFDKHDLVKLNCLLMLFFSFTWFSSCYFLSLSRSLFRLHFFKKRTIYLNDVTFFQTQTCFWSNHTKSHIAQINEYSYSCAYYVKIGRYRRRMNETIVNGINVAFQTIGLNFRKIGLSRDDRNIFRLNWTSVVFFSFCELGQILDDDYKQFMQCSFKKTKIIYKSE